MELNLSNSKPRITTNRSMIKRTFTEKGLPYASELTLENCKDLLTILKWNNENGFKFFRMSSRSEERRVGKECRSVWWTCHK